MDLLPGVPAEYVRRCLSQADGAELKRGKFQSPDSSAALAVNAFAWFNERPKQLPALPGTEDAGWPARRVEVEYCARFPWSGGRHPCLDAFIETDTHILGVESKRHEPFRGKCAAPDFSKAYDRPVWGDLMGPFLDMRDRIRSGETRFTHLDATQLVKHALGLVTESRRRDGRSPILVYLYAEPARWRSEAIALHRGEAAAFAKAVQGAAVAFKAVRWSDWLRGWADAGDAIAAHGRSVARFDLGASPVAPA